MFREKGNFRSHRRSRTLPTNSSLKMRRRFWWAASIRGPIDLKWGVTEKPGRDAGRCVTCFEPTFKQARPGSARARGLRLAWREPECFVPSSTGGEERLRGESRGSSRLEEASQARSPGLKLRGGWIPHSLYLLYCLWLCEEPLATSRTRVRAIRKRVAVLRRTSPSRARECLWAVRIFETATGVACGSWNWTCLSLN